MSAARSTESIWHRLVGPVGAAGTAMILVPALAVTVAAGAATSRRRIYTRSCSPCSGRARGARRRGAG